ncbi:hypothetical protein CHS0354_013924 [Potamilus streckersoni]|uniref:C1q domain-containing protein n=1 Tax=Potamilus streckersoni TaxID=2493646 RepID=A0AAE0RWU5_9BIVA|nr:hypothetical protein CHS0354_013924 [Potamilus streckersoni]
MMYVTSLLLLTFVTITVYSLESTRKHFHKQLWPTSDPGYIPNLNLEDRVARIEEVLSDGMQNLQSELDQQKAKTNILEALLEQQDTKLKDKDAKINELLKIVSMLRETDSIQVRKIKHLEEYVRKSGKCNSCINDRNTKMYPNAITDLVTERFNKSKQHVLNEHESRLVTPYILDAKREMNDKIKKQTPGGPIAFYATVSVPELHLGDHHTVVFDKIITNVGGAYHHNTGIFVAPLSGIYVFSVTAMASAGKKAYLEFIMDGVIINDLVPNHSAADIYVSVTRVFVLEVAQGSEIWVRTTSADDVHGNQHTCISGWLLNPM